MEHTPGLWDITTDKHNCILIVPKGYVKDRDHVVASLDWDLDELENANAKRIVTCVNALAGIDDPDYFLKSIKREVETILHDNTLMLESNNKGEEMLSQAVINTITGNNRRIAFILDQFPKEKS